jgi:hypothetical protein
MLQAHALNNLIKDVTKELDLVALVDSSNQWSSDNVCEDFTSTEPRSSWDGHECGGKKVASVPRPVSPLLKGLVSRVCQ